MMTRGARIIASSLLAAICGAHPSLAGQAVDCREPRIFPGSSVNVMVHIRSVDGVYTKAANRLTALVELHTLFGNLDFGDLAVNALVQLSGQCPSPAEMIEQVTTGSDNSIRPGNGLIFLEGSIYDDGTGLYLRTSIEFFRKDVDATRSVEVGEGERRMSLTVRPPFQRVTLPVRRLTNVDLEKIVTHYEKVAVLRTAPRPNVPGRDLPIEPIGYTVRKREREWMLIQPFGEEPGWIRVDDVAKHAFLWEKLPELDLIRGVLGYLRVQIDTDRGGLSQRPRLVQMRRAAVAALQGYITSQGESGPPRPRALALSLVAALQSGSDTRDPASLEGARQSLSKAAKLVPTSGNLQNALAVAELASCEASGARSACIERVLPAVQRAMIAAPRDVHVLGNARAIYKGLEAELGESKHEKRRDLQRTIRQLDRVIDQKRPRPEQQRPDQHNRSPEAEHN